MLTREELAELKWTESDVQVWGDETVDNEEVDESALLKLAAAAPALALACLDVLSLVGRRVPTVSPAGPGNVHAARQLQAAWAALPGALRAALAAAGVASGPEGEA